MECSHPVLELHRILVCLSKTADGPATWLATKTLAKHARVSLRGSAERLWLQNRCSPAQLQHASHPSVPTVHPQRRDPNNAAPPRGPLGNCMPPARAGRPSAAASCPATRTRCGETTQRWRLRPGGFGHCHTVVFEAALDSRGRWRETQFVYVDGCVHESPAQTYARHGGL